MLKRIREARKNQDGFTLIELLIVIVILGVLAGIVVFAVNGIQDKGQASACKSDVKTVTVAGEAYYAQNGNYAANIAALKTAGLLHSEPASVSYVVAGTPAVLTVTGAAGSACAGYAG
jgi:prepilin-type N-terminal cleavage/methylation domain-containing protein